MVVTVDLLGDEVDLPARQPRDRRRHRPRGLQREVPARRAPSSARRSATPRPTRPRTARACRSRSSRPRRTKPEPHPHRRRPPPLPGRRPSSCPRQAARAVATWAACGRPGQRLAERRYCRLASGTKTSEDGRGPDQRVEPPGAAAPSRRRRGLRVGDVAEQLARGLGHRRDRVPLGEGLQRPGQGARAGRTCWRRRSAGRCTMNAALLTTSGLGTSSPTQAMIQEIA